jgi:hypothetical protein
MKYTLLRLTQDILSAMDSDEVNSIGDTVEAKQVVTVIESVYNNIVSRTDLPEHYELFELVASGDPGKPNVLQLPIYVDTVEWIRYNNLKEQRTEELRFIPLPEFIIRNNNLGNTYRGDLRLSSNFVMRGSNSIPLFYLNDRDPIEYTYIPGVGVVFNSVDLSIEHTAEKTSTLAYGRRNFQFLQEDDFVPPLTSEHFNLLYQESKALAFAELKQTQHAIAEKNAKESRINMQRRKDADKATPFYRNLPYYGRR